MLIEYWRISINTISGIINTLMILKEVQLENKILNSKNKNIISMLNGPKLP